MKQKTFVIFAVLFLTLVSCSQAQGAESLTLNPGIHATHTQSGGSACQGTRYIGTLQFTGDFDYQPNGSYYYSSALGFHKGCLVQPASGADFDLFLQKWNGSTWVIVADSQTTSPVETISSFGGPGYYRWQIYSYNGLGSYTFWRQSP